MKFAEKQQHCLFFRSIKSIFASAINPIFLKKDSNSRLNIRYGIFVLIYFISFATYLIFNRYFLLDPWFFGKWWLTFSFLPTLLPQSVWQWMHVENKYEKTVIGLVSIGPFFTMLFILINWEFSTHFKTIDFNIIGKKSNTTGYILYTDKTEWEKNYPWLFYFHNSMDEYDDFIACKTMRWEIHKGLAGVLLVKERKCIAKF